MVTVTLRDVNVTPRHRFPSRDSTPDAGGSPRVVIRLVTGTPFQAGVPRPTPSLLIEKIAC